jgi:hypothetical protein
MHGGGHQKQGSGSRALVSIPVRPRVRVRSGCLQCRSKRVKCDEAKPVCKRCYRQGTACSYATKTAERQPRPLLPAAQEGASASSTGNAGSSPSSSSSSSIVTTRTRDSSQSSVRSNPGHIDFATSDTIYFDHFREYVANQLGSQVRRSALNYARACLRGSSRESVVD